MDNLKPCPHCGKTETLEFATRRENEDCPNFDDCDAEKCEHGACDYFDNWDCVVCSVIKSGCGAAGGYASCPAEAVEKWNARATLESDREAELEALAKDLYATAIDFNFKGWMPYYEARFAALGIEVEQ